MNQEAWVSGINLSFEGLKVLMLKTRARGYNRAVLPSSSVRIMQTLARSAYFLAPNPSYTNSESLGVGPATLFPQALLGFQHLPWWGGGGAALELLALVPGMSGTNDVLSSLLTS